MTETDAARIEYTTHAHDICGMPIRALGGVLNRIVSSDAARAQTRRDLGAGRLRLHRDGVLPWALYAKGTVEPGWLLSPRFAAAIDSWRRQAVRDPVPLPDIKPVIDVSEFAKMIGLDTLGQVLIDALDGPSRRARLEAIERSPWRWPAPLH